MTVISTALQLHLRLSIVDSGLELAPVFAEQIELPACVETGHPPNRSDAGGGVARPDRVRNPPFGEVGAAAGRDRSTAAHGRKHRSGHDDLLRSCFLHPRQRNLDIGVRYNRALNERVQLRIMQDLPPSHIIRLDRRSRDRGCQRCRAEDLRNGDGGRLIVRTNGTSRQTNERAGDYQRPAWCPHYLTLPLTPSTIATEVRGFAIRPMPHSAGESNRMLRPNCRISNAKRGRPRFFHANDADRSAYNRDDFPLSGGVQI